MADARVGGAFYELTVDASALESGMVRAADTVGQGSERIRRDMTQTADVTQTSIKQQVGAFTSLIGRVTAVTAVFTTFYQIGRRVGEMLNASSVAAAELETSLQGIGRASMEQTTARVKALQTELGDLEGSLFSRAFNAGRRSEIEKELEALYLRQDVLTVEAGKKQAQEAAKAARAAAAARTAEAERSAKDDESVQDRLFQKFVAGLDERSRIEAEAQREVNRISSEISDTPTENRGRIGDLLRLIELVKEARIRALTEIDNRESESRERNHRDELARIAREGAARMQELDRQRDAFARLQEEQTRGFGVFDVGGKLDELATIMRQVAAQQK